MSPTAHQAARHPLQSIHLSSRATVEKAVTTPPQVDDERRIVKIRGATAPYRLEGDAYWQERKANPTRYLGILAYPDGTVPDQRLRVVGEVMKLVSHPML
jgi:hypothetical protein